MILRFRKVNRDFQFLLDLFLVNASAWICGHWFKQSGMEPGEDTFLLYILLFNLFWLVLVLARERYRPVTFVNVSKTTLQLLVTHFLIFITAVFLLENQQLQRRFIVTHYSLLFILVFTSRYLALVLHRRFSLFRYDKRKAVIIGNGEASYKTASYLARPDSGYEFVGVFNDVADADSRLPLLGKKEECLDYCIRYDVKEIFSTLMPESGESFRNMINRAEQECIRVKFVPDFKMIFSRDVNMSMENDLLMIRFRDERLEKIENRIIKRAFDLVFTMFLLVTVLWWLIPIIALMVRWSSPGPVFFIQKRSGRDGRVFDCYKFRSMYVNTEADRKAADRDDSRLTRFGGFLRRTSLDEIPQFFNVLKGDMSVVGPRPHMLAHTFEYRRMINRYMVRHFMKPGITGWAQTNGYRGDITGDRMEERVRKDIWYMENWSFLLDVLILLKTVRLLAFGDKNAF